MISLHEQPGGGPQQDPVPMQKLKPLCPAAKVDSGNWFLVGGRGDEIVILRQPTGTLTKAEAVNLAAWLMVMADPTGEEFERVVKEIVKK